MNPCCCAGNDQILCLAALGEQGRDVVALRETSLNPPTLTPPSSWPMAAQRKGHTLKRLMCTTCCLSVCLSASQSRSYISFLLHIVPPRWGSSPLYFPPPPLSPPIAPLQCDSQRVKMEAMPAGHMSDAQACAVDARALPHRHT